MFNTKYSWILVTVVPSLFAASCGEAPKRFEPLPFVVRVNQVAIGDSVERAAEQSEAVPDNQVGGEEPILATPPDLDQSSLTEQLANCLRDAGLFTKVVTTGNGKEDLQMDVTIKGDDFGPGTPTLGGSIFSTIVWLFAGPSSWFIDNLEYPDSNLYMLVRIRQSGAATEVTSTGQPGEVFGHLLVLKGLQLNMLERADVGHWFLNIILPPWSVDGNAEKAAKNLVTRALEHFGTEEPKQIMALLPREHYKKLGCFLVHDAENDQIFIVAQESVSKVEISSSGVSRELVLNELRRRRVPESEKSTIILETSQTAQGIGASEDVVFYRIPLWEVLPDTWTPEANGDAGGDFVRVNAATTFGVGQWTIRRPVALGAPLSVATAQP